jgi:hypothetical protein
MGTSMASGYVTSVLVSVVSDRHVFLSVRTKAVTRAIAAE